MKDIFLLCHNLIKLNFPKLYIVIYAFILISAFLQLVGTISIIPLMDQKPFKAAFKYNCVNIIITK